MALATDCSFSPGTTMDRWRQRELSKHEEPSRGIFSTHNTPPLELFLIWALGMKIDDDGVSHASKAGNDSRESVHRVFSWRIVANVRHERHRKRTPRNPQAHKYVRI